MARIAFDEKLQKYYQNTMYMGTMTEEYLVACIDVFSKNDIEHAKTLIAEDKKIDKLQLDMEQETISLLLLQAPVAGDLRKIITSIKIFANLERIGDYACHLAKLTAKADPFLYPEFREPIAQMALAASHMIRDSLTAYISDDEQLAKQTAAKDAEIDAAKKNLIGKLIMLSPSNEQEMKQVYRYISICKDLERLGDHITTICEWVVFTVSGKIIDLGKMSKAESVLSL